MPPDSRDFLFMSSLFGEIARPTGDFTKIVPKVAVNTAAPVISGTAEVGETLSCSTGTWVNEPISYLYQWRRNGAAISGATSNTYLVVPADAGKQLTCAVTALNADGLSPPTVSNALSISALDVPVNTTAPVISGTATVGNTLTCTTGIWDNDPTSYAYQWQRDAVNIGGATTNSRLLVTADAGTNITCLVTATNTNGPSAAVSSNLLAIAAVIPVNSVLPVISGTATVDSTLSCTTGTWSNSPTSYAYQWKRGGANIGSATASTYLLVTADAGANITCAVTATNAAGPSTPATSNTLAIGATGTTTVTAANGQWWKFTGSLENGLYVDGSPWVKTATTVSLIEVSAMPTGTGITARNGGMINPTFTTLVEVSPHGSGVTTPMKHGYDGRMNASTITAAVYDETYNNQVTLPLTLSPGNSLVSCESFHPEMDWAGLLTIHSSNTRVIKRMACLTVVSTTPAADAFRPNYFGTTKASWRWSDLNLALLPDITAPFNPKGTDTDDWHLDTASIVWTGSSPYPSYMTGAEYVRIEGMYDLQYFVHPIDSFASTAIKPNFQQEFHSTGQGQIYGILSVYTMCDFADRDIFLKHVIQCAIDAYAVAVGGGFTGRAPFACGAGFFSSPLWFIRLAGLLFNDTPMKNAASIATGKTDVESVAIPKFGENCICYYSEDAHAQYLRVPGRAYASGFPLYGDPPIQTIAGSSTPGAVSDNCSMRDPDRIMDAHDYRYGLPVAAYPDILDDSYVVWPVTAEEIGTYMIGHQCGVGVALASIAMGDDAFWDAGGGAYVEWMRRRMYDAQMWGYWGTQFDYSDADLTSYFGDIGGAGGRGNGWMGTMWEQIVPVVVTPVVSSFSPTDNATGVAIAANLTATFDMNVQFGTGNITLYKTDDTLVEAFDVVTEVGTGAGQVSISGAVLTINPTASLLNSTGYYVQIAATAIESTDDVAFAGILDETTWSFTTVAASSGAWLTVWDVTPTMTLSDPGWNGYTFVLRIPAAALLVSTSTQIRVTIKGGVTEGTVLSAMYVGHGGGTDPYDFTGDQVQLLHGGSGTITAGADTVFTTDAINFVKDGTNPLIIAHQYTSGTGDNLYRAITNDGINMYFKNEAGAATQNKTSYTSTASGSYLVAKVELFTTAYGEQSTMGAPITEAVSAGNTVAERGFAIDNNVTITKLGVRSVTGGTCKMMIVKRVSAGSYDVMVSESFTHPGGGWAMKTLTTPYVVPSTGTFHVAMYSVTTTGMPAEIWESSRAYFVGEAVGTGITFTEDGPTVNTPIVRASGTL